MIDYKALAVDLKRRRNDKGLREAATEAEVTASTLSRAENAKVVDLETYAKLCQWIGVSLDTFVENYGPTLSQRLDQIETRLEDLEQAGGRA